MKLFLITLILSGSLMAKNFSARYEVSLGLLGKVGYADVTLSQEGSSYEMKLAARAIDTAATLTGKLEDTYISKGSLIGGKYRPDTYIRIKKTTRKYRVQTYRFDHINKRVYLTQDESKWISQSSFDPIAFKIRKSKIKENSSHASVLDTYNENDILSSYLNTQKSCNSEQKEYSLLAIGAHNDKKDITLSFLDGLKREEIASNFAKDTGSIYSLHVEPMDKEETELDVLISFDNDGHMREAFLGEVFGIGEIKAKRVYHQVSSR